MEHKEIFPNVGSGDDRTLIRALLQQPRAHAVHDMLERKFEIVFPLLLVFVAALSYIGADRRALLELAEYTFISHLPHPASILLLVGFSLFPKSKQPFFAVSFLVILLLSTLWTFHSGVYDLPPALGFAEFLILSTVFNAVLGLSLAWIALQLEHQFARGPLKPTLDVSLSATLFSVVLFVGTPIALIGVWAGQRWLGLQYGDDMMILGATQMVRTAVFSCICLIFALYPPPLGVVLKSLPIVLLFVLIGLIDKPLGWQTERVFTMMFAISLRFVLPVTVALPITLLGIVTQRIVIPDETMNWSQDYLIFAVLLAVVTMFDLILLNRRAVSRRNRMLRQKLLNSFEFSKFGYFLYSSKLQRFWLDEMIRIAPHRTLSDTGPETLRRMPPKDAERLARILSNHAPEPQGLMIRIADGPVWDADKPYRVYRLHSVSEMSWQYGLVTLGTLTDITEVHEASSALQDTLSQLELSKERQHRLFALISHELRTPAAILSMMADKMNAEEEDWTTLGPRFNNVLEQFLTLMDDLGSVVRDEDLLPANETSFRPNELLQHLSNVYRSIAEDAGLSIDLRSSQKYDALRVSDVGRLQQILGNLIRNSILHSGGSQLVISYREELVMGDLTGKWVIEDNGKGIPEALQPGLFEPFNRQTRGVFSSSEGTGLGMYIVKLFAENLRGSVYFDPPESGGARFVVTVPLKRGEVLKPAEKSATGGPVMDLPVLLVEDNDLVAEITQSQLRKHFSHVMHLETAEQVLEQIEALAPKVVLTDINLPGMNGLTLCRRLRDQGFEGPIFGLSAGANEAEELREVGADGILSKPLAMRKFQQELEVAMRRRGVEIASGEAEDAKKQA